MFSLSMAQLGTQHSLINNLLCLPVHRAKSSTVDVANDKKQAFFNIKTMTHKESLELFDRLVRVGTMVQLSRQALTLREIGHVTGGTVDKTPTRNQEL